mgnify:CR=1 FL=1
MKSNYFSEFFITNAYYHQINIIEAITKTEQTTPKIWYLLRRSSNTIIDTIKPPTGWKFEIKFTLYIAMNV